MDLLNGKQFPRHRSEMFLVRAVDLVAPLPRLAVQIFPTGKRAAGEKVVLDKREGTFHTRRAVGVAALMGYETESEAFSEYLHFRHRNHRAARAAQHHHMRVINH